MDEKHFLVIIIFSRFGGWKKTVLDKNPCFRRTVLKKKGLNIQNFSAYSCLKVLIGCSWRFFHVLHSKIIDGRSFNLAFPPVDLYFISDKSSWKNQVQRTGFLACKNQFRNWFLQATQAVKIQFEIDQFDELDFSKLIFQKSSTDQQGASL